MVRARDQARPNKAKRDTPLAPASDPRAKLLDAAERLLIAVGHSAITTRLLSKEAGVNQGLVHYYYGSMEKLFLAVLERFTARLIARQRAVYATKTTFLAQWREAMGFLEEDLAAGYPKIWLELQAMGWNRPAMRTRLAAVHGQWVTVLTEAFAAAMKHYGIANGPLPVDAMVALVATFNEGIMIERLSGIRRGHASLLRSIDRWLASLEASADENAGAGPASGVRRHTRRPRDGDQRAEPANVATKVHTVR